MKTNNIRVGDVVYFIWNREVEFGIVTDTLDELFGISHVTVQINSSDSEHTYVGVPKQQIYFKIEDADRQLLKELKSYMKDLGEERKKIFNKIRKTSEKINELEKAYPNANQKI